MATPGQMWAESVRALGGDPVAAQASGEDLQRRYGQEHRRYHDLVHVEQVTTTAAELAEALVLPPEDRAIVRLAALAHDVVYDGEPGADELASARWAEEHLLAAGLTGRVPEEVARLVTGTAEHRADPDDPLAAALFDADLSILGADAAAYDGYVSRVREEYAHVSAADWSLGRGFVLRDLVHREALFVTEPARRWWDERAKANLRRELAGLT